MMISGLIVISLCSVHHRDYVRLERVTYGMSLLALALAVVADVNSEL